MTLGGDVVRVTPDAEFTGEGGEVEMVGLYYADAGQHQEHRLFVDHAVPSCRSRVTYKGALQGEGAHTVWVGDVLIRANAEGTDTYELNRNLVLSDGARADSVPNLEIETGEIEGAGHASRPPDGSTTSSSSTCARAASPRRTPAASWCAASSPSSSTRSASRRSRSASSPRSRPSSSGA